MWRVLCVDDDAVKAGEVAEFFTAWKTDNPIGEFEVRVETNFATASERLANERFDLVTLDLHAGADPDPEDAEGGATMQQGRRVLNELKERRFVPVIFYSGYAEKIADLRSLVVRVVKKGENDLAQVRDAAKSLFATRLPDLMRHIEKEQRSYLWDTIDRKSTQFAGEEPPDELLYLLARRIAARLNRESLKELLGHKLGHAKPIEFYIYPHIQEKIKTGCICGPDAEGLFWIVATPSCDFEQEKAERILLIAAIPLSTDKRFADWQTASAASGNNPPSKKQQEVTAAARNKVRDLVRNRAGDRSRFLPGTFFLPDLLVDMQILRQVTVMELEAMPIVCRLDSPYREELLLYVSSYYGRLGTPDLEKEAVIKRLGLD